MRSPRRDSPHDQVQGRDMLEVGVQFCYVRWKDLDQIVHPPREKRPHCFFRIYYDLNPLLLKGGEGPEANFGMFLDTLQ